MTPEHQREFDRMLRADRRATIIQGLKRDWFTIAYLLGLFITLIIFAGML